MSFSTKGGNQPMNVDLILPKRRENRRNTKF